MRSPVLRSRTSTPSVPHAPQQLDLLPKRPNSEHGQAGHLSGFEVAGLCEQDEVHHLPSVSAYLKDRGPISVQVNAVHVTCGRSLCPIASFYLWFTQSQ